MLELKVDFLDSLIDIDRKITLVGAPAQTPVVIKTKTERAGHVWRSEITAQSDANGEIDLSTVAPISGSYTEPNAMGIIYAQQAENAATTDLFPISVHHALHTEIEARVGDVTALTVLTQRLTHETVQRVEINESGIKGILFVPATAAQQPAVIVLKRQDAQAPDEAHAALYAARGYAALALDYDATPELTANLAQLSYFEQALDWLRETIRPKHHFVAVSGYEQGAELALILGVHLADKVSAVLACEPTAATQSPYPLAIEEIQGPLLLASGQAHTSSAYHQAIVERLQQAGFDYNFQWYDFEGVGAGLRFPHVPTTLTATDAKQVMALAQANKSLWFSMIGFLHQAVAEAAAPKQLNA